MNVAKLVLVMGLPCSGKTTYSRSCHFDNFAYISPHDFKDRGHLALELFRLAEHGRDIVVDDFNLTKKDRRFYLDIISTHCEHNLDNQYVFECHQLTASVKDVIQNAQQRYNEGGDRLNKVILVDCVKVMECPSQEEGFQVIIKVPPESIKETLFCNRQEDNTSKQKCLFFSVDRLGEDLNVCPRMNKAVSDYYHNGFRIIAIVPDTIYCWKYFHRNVIDLIKQISAPVDQIMLYPISKVNDSDIDFQNSAILVRQKGDGSIGENLNIKNQVAI